MVDGKRLAPCFGAADARGGVRNRADNAAIRYELEVDEPLFDALVKGKSFHFELPKAKSHTIRSRASEKHALAMRRQCF